MISARVASTRALHLASSLSLMNGNPLNNFQHRPRVPNCALTWLWNWPVCSRSALYAPNCPIVGVLSPMSQIYTRIYTKSTPKSTFQVCPIYSTTTPFVQHLPRMFDISPECSKSAPNAPHLHRIFHIHMRNIKICMPRWFQVCTLRSTLYNPSAPHSSSLLQLLTSFPAPTARCSQIPTRLSSHPLSPNST